MRKTIKLAVVAALALGATSAFATNGTGLIGYGVKARGMGGASISNFLGAESAFANPALITKSKANHEVTIGATLLMPEVSFTADAAANSAIAGAAQPATTNDSTAGDGMIPAVAAINKVSDNYYWGMALYGVGGMGVDYRLPTANSPISGANTSDNLLLMRASVPFAYTTNDFSVGFAPVIEYGSLAMGAAGSTADIAFGYELGLTYSMGALTFGADYKSAVEHDFVGTFNSNINPATGALITANPQSKLDTPSVLGAGISYVMGANTFAFDWKEIGYGSATGLKDFGWEDQDVYSLGYAYDTKNWSLRLGYNYGKSPLPTAVINPLTFAQVVGSAMQFPGVTEKHYTIGGSFNLNDACSIDLAYMIGKGSTTTTLPVGFGGGTFSADNDQTSASAALNYTF